MNHIIRTLSLLALLSTACGEAPDDDALDGLTPDCVPAAGGLACAADLQRHVTYTGATVEDGQACFATITPGTGYHLCE